MKIWFFVCLAASVAQPVLGASAGVPPREISLRGPEVVKLDWNTRALQVADINRDGLNDIIVANNDHSSIDLLYQLKPGAPNEAVPPTVSVNRWEPVLEDARFRKGSVTTGVTVFDLVVGDLNGDGRPDLVYAGDPQALTIRYQLADGSLSEKKINEAPAPLQFVGCLKIADLNGDGRNDLAMLGQKELAIYYQDSKGELGPAVRYPLPDDGCYGLEICDVNGDGLPDLVYLCNNTRDGLRVRLQNAEHEFGPEQAYAMRPSRCTLQILQQAHGKERAVFAFAQDATGQLEEFRLDEALNAKAELSMRPRVFSPRPGSKTPFSYAFGDFNGDGLLDLAVSDPEGAQVYVYLRQRDGSFTRPQKYPVFADARSIAAGDWDGDGRDELILASAKEQAVGVASFTKDGRLGYPQPFAVTGKPVAVTAGMLDGKSLCIAVVREEKGKRAIDLWTRKNGVAEMVKSIELSDLKTDPRAIRMLDANQDGRLDLAVFTPFEPLRLFVQGDAFTFKDLSSSAGFRRGLVDNLDSANFALGDIDLEGKPELLVSNGSFARAMRVNAQGELTVVDQFNARDPASEITASLVIPNSGGKKPRIVLYDRKGEQFQILEANGQALYQVTDTKPAGKIDVVGAEVRTSPTAGTEAFLLGKDRFWWMQIDRGDFNVTTVATYATDLPDIHYSDIVAGDLNGDGLPELVCIDPDKNLLEILTRGKEGRWESRLHFKVFETDEHFQGHKGSPLEPRETVIADVTGDGKKDLILLVHDRILVYPQE